MAEFPLLAGFLGGLVVWCIGRNLGDARGTYKQSVGISCYALAIFPLTTVAGGLGSLVSPGSNLGQVLWLWGFYIVARGIIVLHRSRPVQTFVVLGVLALAVEGFSFYAMNQARARMEQAGNGTASPSRVLAPKTAAPRPGQTPGQEK
jgi:hypothetical protein